MRISSISLGVLWITLLLSSSCASHQKHIETQSFAVYPIDQMVVLRSQLAQREELAKLVSALENEAKVLLNSPEFSVLQKQHTPPSGVMNDYYSMGVYWWPDSTKEDGLPYIRRDGVRNPEYDQFDGPAIAKMSRTVFKLSLAYFYTQEKSYADKAIELIRVWFLDPERKMNPHLEYGQAIPGRVEGRGIGIIETGNFLKVLNAVAMLDESGAIPSEIRQGLKAWFLEYNYWLLTSEKGWDERLWHNNHGSSYDSQVASFALFTGEDSVARLILDSVKIKRIDRQIEPDGSQPWELERTKSLSYSLKNLDHLIENAILAQHIGIDLWHYESEDKGSISQAIKFLIPYMQGEHEWPYTQYGGIEKKRQHYANLIWVASQYLDDPLIHQTISQLQEEGYYPSRIHLLYPENESQVPQQIKK
ncbi:MAG: alginate lyase family protein [Bacteroidota bacterium]